MSFQKLIQTIATEFDSAHEGSSNYGSKLKDLLTRHETDFQALYNKRSRSKKVKNPDAPKKTNWQAIWESSKYGCRAYSDFDAKLEELLKTVDDPKRQRFKINKLLKLWAVENQLYEQWLNWAKQQLLTDGKPCPNRDSGKSDEGSKNKNSTETETTTTTPIVCETETEPEKTAPVQTKSQTNLVVNQPKSDKGRGKKTKS